MDVSQRTVLDAGRQHPPARTEVRTGAAQRYHRWGWTHAAGQSRLGPARGDLGSMPQEKTAGGGIPPSRDHDRRSRVSCSPTGASGQQHLVISFTGED
jgi:hypothetical protein